MSFYSYIKSHQLGWRGKVHKSDAELGFAPIPNSRGAHLLPLGSDIPMRYDKDGFRVPVNSDENLPRVRPLILTLGCSHTYGDANYAEDTYPYLVGQYLGGSTLNAGVCSYGLSQMLILARRLIPFYKPDYLIVQYSTWLIDRAQYFFAPTYFGKIPTPFFFDREKVLLIHPPVFRCKILDDSVYKYRESRKTLYDFTSFMIKVSIPLFIHDDFNMFIFHIERHLNIIPSPTKNRDQVVKFVYGEIAKMAEEADTEMIIVVLGYGCKPVTIPRQLFPINAIIVDAHSALLKRLPVKTDEAYKKLYAHWRGNPPRVVETHPNPLAYKIIAEEIVKTIKGKEIQPDKYSSRIVNKF